MYVLYYYYSDGYGEHNDFEIMAVSESKQILEDEINRIMMPVRDYKEKVEALEKAREKFYSSSKKKLRDWLIENIDCVREIRPQLFNGEFYIKDFHNLNNTPYSPNVKKREQEKSIDVIVATYWELFLNTADENKIKRQEEFIDISVLNVPVIVIEDEQEKFNYFEIEKYFRIYEEDCLKIEKVKVL